MLTAPELRSWYQASLTFSGFSEISQTIYQIWAACIHHLSYGLPPGLVAKISEKLTHQRQGTLASTPPHPLENEVIDRLMHISNLKILEGDFILLGPDPTYLQHFFKVWIRNVQAFDYPDLCFGPHLLKSLFETSANPCFDANKYLKQVYQNLLDKLAVSPPFRPRDVFEIRHPQLFQDIQSVPLYHHMQDALNAIQPQLVGPLDLPEISTALVARFGEPEVLPLGGYDAITNRGSIASLLPSELAYIDTTQAIDYFDYKYLHQELLYFQREEGQVFRLRRHFHLIFNLRPGLEMAHWTGLFFAYGLILINLIQDVFCKDLLRISVFFEGHKPTSLRSALGFFQHFLEARDLLSTLDFPEELSIHKDTESPYQNWVLGETSVQADISLPFQFPDLNDLKHFSRPQTYRYLAQHLNQYIQEIANHASG